jgi:hypothetical protein
MSEFATNMGADTREGTLAVILRQSKKGSEAVELLRKLYSGDSEANHRVTKLETSRVAG